MFSINEKSTLWLTLSFKNKEGGVITPLSITYRIDSDEINIKADTTVTPASTVEIEIPPSLNEIIGGVKSQTNVVTVTSVSQTDTQTQEFTYKIKNLRYIS